MGTERLLFLLVIGVNVMAAVQGNQVQLVSIVQLLKKKWKQKYEQIIQKTKDIRSKGTLINVFSRHSLQMKLFRT